MILISFLLLAGALYLLVHLLYRRYWNRALGMALSFSSPEAFEGEALTLREEVTNLKPLPLPLLTAKYRLSRNLVFEDEPEAAVTDHYYRSDVFAVNLFQRIVRKQGFTCAKRGFYRVEDMTLVNGGLFHSSTMVQPQRCDATLTVFPKLLAFDGMDALYRQMTGDVEVRRFTNPDPFAFRGIRAYEPGDDFRHLNYKASAKSGELMVNIYSATSSRQVLILLNLEPYAAVTRDSVLEGSIRIAASAAAYFTGLGLAVGLRTNGCDIETGGELALRPGGGQAHLHSLLESFARISLQRPMRPFAALMEEAMPQPGRAAEPYYLLVSANTGDGVEIAFNALLASGAAGRWVVPWLPQHNARPPQNEHTTLWEL